MSQTTINIRDSLMFALYRAAAVVWGGFVALGLYVLIVLVGPQLEGRMAPVLTHYSLEQIRAEEGGGFSFVSRFYKARDCSAFGTAWFAPDADGDMIKLQASRIDDPQPIQTGPTGWREGSRQAFYPPAGTPYMMGVVNHDCGFIWQTRTILGAFPIENGLPRNPRPGEALPSLPASIP